MMHRTESGASKSYIEQLDRLGEQIEALGGPEINLWNNGEPLG